MTHSVYEPFAVLLGDEFRDHSIRAYMKARNGLCDTVGRLFCRSHGHELANDRRARAATVLRAAVALAKAEGIGQHELDELALIHGRSKRGRPRSRAYRSHCWATATRPTSTWRCPSSCRSSSSKRRCSSLRSQSERRIAHGLRPLRVRRCRHHEQPPVAEWPAPAAPVQRLWLALDHDRNAGPRRARAGSDRPAPRRHTGRGEL